PSRKHRLKTAEGFFAVAASPNPAFDGAVRSSTTAHALPSPVPVLVAVQPAGTFPRSALVKVSGLGCAPMPATPAAITTIAAKPRLFACIVQPRWCRVGQPFAAHFPWWIIARPPRRGNGPLRNQYRVPVRSEPGAPPGPAALPVPARPRSPAPPASSARPPGAATPAT